MDEPKVSVFQSSFLACSLRIRLSNISVFEMMLKARCHLSVAFLCLATTLPLFRTSSSVPISLMKSSLIKTRHCTLVLALAVAFLGWSLSSASSPNQPLLVMVDRILGAMPSPTSTEMSTTPSFTM